ncbi:MAG: hypothetical protein ACTSUR_01270 [Candidatus Heimdallarchaeaceae archaeon]
MSYQNIPKIINITRRAINIAIAISNFESTVSDKSTKIPNTIRRAVNSVSEIKILNDNVSDGFAVDIFLSRCW